MKDLFRSNFCCLGIGINEHQKQFGYYSDVLGDFQEYTVDEIHELVNIARTYGENEMLVRLGSI